MLYAGNIHDTTVQRKVSKEDHNWTEASPRSCYKGWWTTAGECLLPVLHRSPQAGFCSDQMPKIIQVSTRRPVAPCSPRKSTTDEGKSKQDSLWGLTQDWQPCAELSLTPLLCLPCSGPPSLTEPSVRGSLLFEKQEVISWSSSPDGVCDFPYAHGKSFRSFLSRNLSTEWPDLFGLCP